MLDKAHELRNLAEYEGEMDIDERLVADVVTASEVLLAAIDSITPA